MKKLTEETAFLSPADKSIVLVKRSRATGDAWMTIHLKNAMFGLRRIESSPVKLSAEELKMAGLAAAPETSAAADPAVGSEEAVFFLHTDDDVRTTVSLGTSAEQCAGKPDESGTVTLTTAFVNGLVVAACSNGNVVMYPPHAAAKSDPRAGGGGGGVSPRQAKQSASVEKATALAAPERSRLVCDGGVVVRFLAEGGPFQKDIMMPNGTRVLIRAADEADTSQYAVAGVLETIVNEGPEGWKSVILDVAGRVYYNLYDYRDEENNPENESAAAGELVQSLSLKNICRFYIDAETEALVSEFRDGRVMCISTDDLQEVYFPDGTRFVMHQSGEVLFMDKHGLGQLEIDRGTDDISRRHSRGQKVPIAKVEDYSLAAAAAVLLQQPSHTTDLCCFPSLYFLLSVSLSGRRQDPHEDIAA
jgi:hypothetical protein